MEKQRLHELFQKYIDDRATRSELDEFFDGLRESGADEQVAAWVREHLAGSDPQRSGKLAALVSNVDRRLKASISRQAAQTSPLKRLAGRRWFWPVSAAAVILAVLAGLWWHPSQPVDGGIVEDRVHGYQNDVMPASVGAALTFSDGRTVQLDSQATLSPLPVAADDGSYSLSVPHGRTFSMIFPDGSKAWLNAGTTLEYGADFNQTDRSVNIRGEAFFDVVHDADRPFRVTVNGKTIEVLGTRFNVDAYGDQVNTTLVAGRVKIINKHDTQLLAPGQLAVSTDGETQVSAVNVAQHIAWTRGDFHFDNESIQRVMEELARWYNLDVTYSGLIPDRKIKGTIGRNVRLSEVLEMLGGVTGATFDIRGRALNVTVN